MGATNSPSSLLRKRSVGGGERVQAFAALNDPPDVAANTALVSSERGDHV